MKRKAVLFVLLDVALLTLAIVLAFRVRFPHFMAVPNFIVFKKYFFFFVAIKVFSYYLFGLYGGIWEYASTSEAFQILNAVTFGSMAVTSIMFFTRITLINVMPMIPRSVILIDWFFNLLFIGTIRFLPRLRKDFRIKKILSGKRVLIIGAGDMGDMVLRSISAHPSLGYKPVCFVDDDKRKIGRNIHNLKVLGTIKDIPSIVFRKQINEIIIAIASISGKTIREIISYCQKAKIELKIVPEFAKILKGGAAVMDLRSVQPEDLLGRKVVEISIDDATAFLRGKTVLVSGAGGSIGSEICRQIAMFGPKGIIFYEHYENDVYFLELELKENYPAIMVKTIIGDIKDISVLKYVFSKYKPQIVFHAAAHKHVPLLEENPASAVRNNIVGTRNLIYAASHYRVESFVLISTDKAVHPTSAMGASKRIAEMLLQAKAGKSKTKFMAVRFGNVLGSSGSVVQLFKKQIEHGGPITVTHPDVKRYFMTVQEAVRLVIQAGAIGRGGEIFVLDMGEQIKIVDLAKELISLSGLEIDKDITIKFVGLRPGEKLYEETLHDMEKDRATKHDKIFVTSPDVFDPGKLRRDIKDLEGLARIMAEDKIVEKLKKMIPSYSPDSRWKEVQ